ncbi:MAG: Gfo/Idh/MocA family oxidoreductase [Ruminococcaceae bacterium]|nr:Gfo/Idh/MocA family oxidoreductase [Oscillospiraceae bacterium]
MIQREKKTKVKVGYIGLGRRGYSMLSRCFANMADVDFAWVCDLSQEKLDRAVQTLTEAGRHEPKPTTNYHDILADPDVDAVIVMTGWDMHVQCSLDSLKAGKYTAVEVGCAYDLSECYALVKAYEESGAPLMMLENCCYGRREMMALNMVKQGLFGEIVHCDGGYLHYLNDAELFVKRFGEDTYSHYRAFDYLHRNCEQYPTHAFGPISKVLGINRGNRILTLSSFASKSRGAESFLKEHPELEHPMQGKRFRQGDVITTVMTCANGETVRLTLDTTLPRPYYSRNFTVRGTKGCCVEEGGFGTFYLEGMKEPVVNNEESFYEKYDHPLYAEYASLGITDDHGGIDWLVGRAFIESVKAGTDTPIDAYDTATWLAIASLSEASIAKGGAPVEFPDFTNGKWFRREPAVRGKYCLDDICSDPSVPFIPVISEN